MKVERDKNRRTIFISQIAFINIALIAAEMQDSKGVNAPIIDTPHFLQNIKPVTNKKLV